MEIIRPLQTMLHNSHKYISIFNKTLQRLQSQGQPYNHKIVICPEKAPTGEHRRTYNAPEASEVAILIVGQNEKVTNRGIVLENHNSQLRRVDEIHPWYDSLQYLILFPNTKDGYSIYLHQVDPLTRLSLPINPTVSAMNYAYRIMVRDINFKRILRATTLFHQFLVYMYAKIENKRLIFIKATSANSVLKTIFTSKIV